MGQPSGCDVKGDKIKNLEMEVVNLKAKLKERVRGLYYFYLERQLRETKALIKKLKQ